LHPISVYLSPEPLNLDWYTANCFIVVFLKFYTLQFIVAVSAIRLRFKALNVPLNQLLTNEKAKFSVLKTSDVLAASKLFHDLCDLIVLFNEIFTFHAIFIFLNSLVSLRRVWVFAAC
jgi:hypothetical protein